MVSREKRGLIKTWTGLRERRGVRFTELIEEPSMAGRCDVRWGTDLWKRRRDCKRRWLALHSFLAGLEQLINPVLNDVVAALNTQCSDVGQKEHAPFLLRQSGQKLNEMGIWR